MLLAAAFAAIGGVLWGFGILGKRLGVQGSTNENKNIRATATIFVYTLTTLIAPLIDFVSTDRALITETFSRPEWVSRIPGIMACGLISGLGGVLGTIAFAWSAGVNSALISMVENGTYTMAGAVFIAIFFQELPRPMSYVAGALIMLGILLAQSTSKRKKMASEEDSEDSDDDLCPGFQSDSDVEGGPSAASDGESGEEGTSQSAQEQDTSSPEADQAVDKHASMSPESKIAPTALRKRAIVFAVVAGMCWGLGPVGKKYGVYNVPEDRKHVWTTCTYLMYMASTTLVPFGKLVCTDKAKVMEAYHDRNFRWLLLGTTSCGLASGLGGLISTLAFAQGGDQGPIISMIENGIYTIAGALMITLVFKEWPTKRQLVSAGFVVAGLLVAGLA